MVSFLNNTPQLEANPAAKTAEQLLWRAVFVQAIQDTFGISPIPMSSDEYREAKWFGKIYNEDFIELCEMAGFDPERTFERLKRYNLIKKGIIWNYSVNGKRRFADVTPIN